MQSTRMAISRTCFRYLSSRPTGPARPPPTTLIKAAPPASAAIKEVPGLSEKCVLPKSQPLGPGAATNSEYKVPEYFCYDKNSFAEAEIEMANFRCPQPNANRKN